jgi:long-chain acyl-CoA synthetase
LFRPKKGYNADVELVQRVLGALHAWGSNPAFMEIGPSGMSTPIGAEVFRERVLQTAAQLKPWGVEPGQRVALFLGNSSDFVATFLAILHNEAVVVPVPLEYRRIELDEIMANADPGVVIAEREHLGVLSPYLAGRTTVLRSNGQLALHSAARTGAEPADTPAGVAAIGYTYRGYGYPLGAMIPQEQYLHGVRAIQEGLGARAGERMMLLLPMTHIFAMISGVLLPLLHGLTVVLVKTIHPRVIFECLAEQEVDYVTAVPEIYEMLYRCRDMAPRLPHLSGLVSGGSVLSAESYLAIRRAFGVEVGHGYGLTEFTPVSRNIYGESEAGTAGPISTGVDMRIGAVEEDRAGEILVRAADMAKGYYRRPKETAEAFAGSWLRTGDLGYMRGEHLVFLREKKQTCKVNGRLVDLQEIRRALAATLGLTGVELSCKDGRLVGVLRGDSQETIRRDARRARPLLASSMAAYKIPKLVGAA